MLRDMLSQQGLEVGRRHVRTLMRRMAIQTLYRKPNTSKPAPGHRIYPYLLRGLAITRPNQAWAMDITYIPMARGFVYLAAVLDWFSRRVLAWRLSITMDTSFCIEALEEAIEDLRPCRKSSTLKVPATPQVTAPCSRMHVSSSCSSHVELAAQEGIYKRLAFAICRKIQNVLFFYCCSFGKQPI